MNDCLFCKIIAGDIPSQKVYEDDAVFAFRDIQPQAPIHILIVPKEHMPNALSLTGQRADVAARVFAAAAVIAKQEGIDETGFRIVTNCGRDAAQSVGHLHFHLLGGAQLSERMS